MLKDSGMIHRGRGLVDLIAGKTPTFSGWTVDPTDGEKITDGDISTYCTTGYKVAGSAWEYAYFEWDLGGFYNFMCTFVGCGFSSAGTINFYLFLWDGANWIRTASTISSSSWPYAGLVGGGVGSKVRLGITPDVAATITPNVREFHAWRL